MKKDGTHTNDDTSNKSIDNNDVHSLFLLHTCIVCDRSFEFAMHLKRLVESLVGGWSFFIISVSKQILQAEEHSEILAARSRKPALREPLHRTVNSSGDEYSLQFEANPNTSSRHKMINVIMHDYLNTRQGCTRRRTRTCTRAQYPLRVAF